MATRAFDSTLAGLILISIIYLGTIFLIIDIPIFNQVNPISLAIVVLAMLLGLPFGLFSGRWYTNEQLKVLSQNNEFRGLGSKQIYVVTYVGLAVFLACAFLVKYFELLDLGKGLIVFMISATFTLFLSRIILISSWEKHNRKTVMMGWNRVYTTRNTYEFR